VILIIAKEDKLMEGLSRYPGMKSSDNPWREIIKTERESLIFDMTEEAYGSCD
jgi:hypothetical protein